MNVTAFELKDGMDESQIPDWVAEAAMSKEVTLVLPFLADCLAQNKIFTSKSEARSMMKNRGLSIFCYEGHGPKFKIEGDNYKTVDNKPVKSFNDKTAVITDPQVRWCLIDGDIVKIGSRRFIKIVEKNNESTH